MEDPSEVLCILHTGQVVLMILHRRRSRYRERCTDRPYQSQGKAWQWPSLQRPRANIAIRHRGLGRESRALFDGWWLVLEGPSSDNAGAALPTDVSVYTWLSQAGRFIRAVVTSNVERVMVSQVDMNRYCHSIVGKYSALPCCPDVMISRQPLPRRLSRRQIFW